MSVTELKEASVCYSESLLYSVGDILIDPVELNALGRLLQCLGLLLEMQTSVILALIDKDSIHGTSFTA